MSEFEGIVRPFQLPDTAKPVRLISAGQQQLQRVLLQFGRAGSGKVFSGSTSYNKTFYCDQQIVEKSTDGGG